MKNKVSQSQLKFKIETSLLFSPDGTNYWDANFIDRYFARKVACSILNEHKTTYQFGGYTGPKKLSYELVDADRHQLAHWILRRVGYQCSIADLRLITGEKNIQKIT